MKPEKQKLSFWGLQIIIFIISCLFATLITSCKKADSSNIDYEICYKDSYTDCFKMEFKTIVIDSCQYLIGYAGSDRQIFTHKGNCKNHKK